MSRARVIIIMMHPQPHRLEAMSNYGCGGLAGRSYRSHSAPHASLMTVWFQNQKQPALVIGVLPIRPLTPSTPMMSHRAPHPCLRVLKASVTHLRLLGTYMYMLYEMRRVCVGSLNVSPCRQRRRQWCDVQPLCVWLSVTRRAGRTCTVVPTCNQPLITRRRRRRRLGALPPRAPSAAPARAAAPRTGRAPPPRR